MGGTRLTQLHLGRPVLQRPVKTDLLESKHDRPFLHVGFHQKQQRDRPGRPVLSGIRNQESKLLMKSRRQKLCFVS